MDVGLADLWDSEFLVSMRLSGKSEHNTIKKII